MFMDHDRLFNRLSYNDGAQSCNRDKHSGGNYGGGMYTVYRGVYRGKRRKQGGRVMDRQEFYQDGVTRVTDPFYICVCEQGHKAYSPIYMKKCAFCGAVLRQCVPADKYNKSKGDQ